MTILKVHCRRLPKKLAGSTIIETIVSLTILLTILTLSMTQIDRINASINPQVVYKAHQITNIVFNRGDILIETLDKFEIAGYEISKTIQPLYEGLYLVHLTVLDQRGRSIYTRKKLMADGIEL